MVDAFPHLELTIEQLPAIRNSLVETFKAMLSTLPHGTPTKEIDVPGPAGAHDVHLLIFIPPGPAKLRPAIYHIHGGGMVMGSPTMAQGRQRERANLHDAVVVAVKYRLAPETPFPGAIEDCYVGLAWLFANAASLGVDPVRIAIMGESAGGGLAAALALLARDRGRLKPCAQILIYPMLDHRTGTAEEPNPNLMTGEFGWTREHNRFGWLAMQGSYDLSDERVGYFSPARAGDLSGLPPAFIGVGALDLFLEEDIDYARRLVRSGVPVECHVYAGAVHGADSLPGSVGAQFVEDTRRAMTRLLQR